MLRSGNRIGACVECVYLCMFASAVLTAFNLLTEERERERRRREKTIQYQISDSNDGQPYRCSWPLLSNIVASTAQFQCFQYVCVCGCCCFDFFAYLWIHLSYPSAIYYTSTILNDWCLCCGVAKALSAVGYACDRENAKRIVTLYQSIVGIINQRAILELPMHKEWVQGLCGQCKMCAC